MYFRSYLNTASHCRAGEISATELQEYFAKVLGRGEQTEQLLLSIASLIPAGQGQTSLQQAARSAASASLPLPDEWKSVSLDTSSVDKNQLQAAVQAAEESTDRQQGSKRMASQGTPNSQDPNRYSFCYNCLLGLSLMQTLMHLFLAGICPWQAGVMSFSDAVDIAPPNQLCHFAHEKLVRKKRVMARSIDLLFAVAGE